MITRLGRVRRIGYNRKINSGGLTCDYCSWGVRDKYIYTKIKFGKRVRKLCRSCVWHEVLLYETNEYAEWYKRLSRKIKEIRKGEVLILVK